MKNELRMGKGEFSYHRDWAESDDEGEAKPPYKQMILALIADEVSTQVEAKVSAAIKQMEGKHASFMESHKSASTTSQDRAVLLAKIEGLEQTVKMLQAKPQVVQTPQGKLVMQQPSAAKPSAYSVDVKRGADGLIKSLDLVPK